MDEKRDLGTNTNAGIETEQKNLEKVDQNGVNKQKKIMYLWMFMNSKVHTKDANYNDKDIVLKMKWNLKNKVERKAQSKPQLYKNGTERNIIFGITIRPIDDSQSESTL